MQGSGWRNTLIHTEAVDLLLPIPYILAFVLIILKHPFFRITGIGRAALTAAFLLKIAAGAAMYFIYTLHYTDRSTADIFKFFDDSRILHQALFQSPADYLRIMTGFGNDTPHFDQYYRQMNNWYGIYPSNVYGDGHLMIRYNALLRLISFGSYPVHSVITCFLAFAGLTGLAKVALPRLTGYSYGVYAGVYLLPSVLFWSSGLLKDGLIFFVLGMILYGLDRQLREGWSWRDVVLIAGCLLVLRYSKFYLFLFFVPLAVAFAWSSRGRRQHILPRYLLVLAVTLLLGLLAGYLNPVYDVVTILSRKQQDFLALARAADAGSLLSVRPLAPDGTALVRQLVPGFITTLTRPYPWEVSGLITLLPAIENGITWMCILLSLCFLRRPGDPNFFWFSFLFVAAVFTLTGLITPVSGAIVRYKAPALPFLFMLLMQVTDKSGYTRLFKKHKGVSLAKG